MKIYVGNLAFDVTKEEIETEFAAFGKVESVAVISDKFTGRPKGFAFVEMLAKEEAEAAIAALNGKALRDRAIVVNVSRPREENRSGGGGFGNKRSSGGYGGGRGGRSSGGGRQKRY
jgi:cold-inducible RNA-binding protein